MGRLTRRPMTGADAHTGCAMATPFESASLNLQLFDLRREPVLREARQWFLGEFNPDSFGDLVAVVGGDRNASFRMVLGYWDMAASLVTTGAIDADAFRAAHGEMFGTFCKIEPFLAEMRAGFGQPAIAESESGMTLRLTLRGRRFERPIAAALMCAATAAGLADQSPAQEPP